MTATDPAAGTRRRAAVPHTVVIVGAGFAGIGAAIRLLQAGVEDFVILERSTHVGGTWRDTTYPGAACDIPSLLYSYSFAPNPDWSRGYSASGEILSYIEAIVERFGLASRIRFGADVSGMSFDEAAGVWHVQLSGRGRTAARTVDARAVVLAAGPLANASLPTIAGIDTFTGHKIHSARWDHGYDFAGKRVAVIGTGASAVQIIPELVRQAGHVTVYQRTPGWVLPRLDYSSPSPLRMLFRRVPVAQSAARSALFWAHETMALGLVWPTAVTAMIERLARAHLRAQVRDPWMRRQLTPDFRAGCKRMLMSSDFYPALQQDNCKLITWPIARISPDGIRTADGIERRFDAIVFATGYDVGRTGTPFPITGREGRVLAAEWSRGVSGYKSVNVAGYPNLFFTFGPNSGPGHNSALVYMESQIDYIVSAVRTLVDEDLRFLDVLPASQRRYNDRLQRRLGRTTWNSGCKSWYLTDDGYNGTMYPGFATQYARQLARLDVADYEFAPRIPAVSAAASPAVSAPASPAVSAPASPAA